MQRLWSDTGTQKCFAEMMRSFRMNDSARHFLDSLVRISQPNYLPSQEDVLRARLKKTSQNVETLFSHGDLDFR